ncbi:ENDUC protein, partial [Tichodroma muraria]|nr:ENDUC protein [Tichodroma muraria]
EPREVPEPPRAVPGSPRAVSDAELRELSEQLLAADSNRAGPGQLELNLKGSGSDTAAPRLFSYVSPELLARPTFSRLLALLDNYEPRTGRDETETAEEQREQKEFLDAALDTPVLALLERFVLSKGGAAPSLWCPHAVPTVSPPSSHSVPMVAPLSLQCLPQVLPVCSTVCPWTGFPDVLSLQFLWDGHSKPRGSLLVGSSPEFDLALFTLCFLARPDRQCHVSLGGEAATIQTYTWDKRRLVASAYPLTP